MNSQFKKLMVSLCLIICCGNYNVNAMQSNPNVLNNKGMFTNNNKYFQLLKDSVSKIVTNIKNLYCNNTECNDNLTQYLNYTISLVDNLFNETNFEKFNNIKSQIEYKISYLNQQYGNVVDYNNIVNILNKCKLSKYNTENIKVNSEIPISIDDCKQIEDILKTLYEYNIQYYGEECNGTINSKDAYEAAKKFVEIANNMMKYKSNHSIINCYKQLLALHQFTSKIQITGSTYTYNDIKEFFNRFVPFQKYVLQNIYNKIYDRPINLANFYKLEKIINELDPKEKIGNTYEINYQLEQLIHKTQQINKRIEEFNINVQPLKILSEYITKNIMPLFDNYLLAHKYNLYPADKFIFDQYIIKNKYNIAININSKNILLRLFENMYNTPSGIKQNAKKIADDSLVQSINTCSFYIKHDFDALVEYLNYLIQLIKDNATLYSNPLVAKTLDNINKDN